MSGKARAAAAVRLVTEIMHSTISGHLMKARQDDAARAGERDRVLVEARRIRRTGRPHARWTGPARHRIRLTAVSRMRIAALRDPVDTRINGC
jgi:hypothetical protein